MGAPKVRHDVPMHTAYCLGGEVPLTSACWSLRVILRRGSGAYSSRAPLLVPAITQSSGVSVRAVMGAPKPSHRMMICRMQQLLVFSL